MVMTLDNKLRFAFSKNHGTRKTTLLTTLCVWWVLTWTGAQACDSATATVKLEFNCSSPVPSESLVLSSITTLLSSRSASIPDNTEVLGFFYNKISNSSYEVVFIISVSVEIPDNYKLRKNVYKQIQASIDDTLNMLLNDPGAEQFKSHSAFFRNSEVDVEYSFGCGDCSRPISYLNELKDETSKKTTVPPTTTRNNNRLSNIVMLIKIEFRNLTKVPSEDEVLKLIKDNWNMTTVSLGNVSIHNITYEQIGSDSYRINFEFRTNNVSISENIFQLTETYNSIQNTMNSLLNSILNGPNSGQFTYPQVTFSGNSTTIVAVQVYVFERDDIKTPSGLLLQLVSINCQAPSTTTTPAPIASLGVTPTTTTADIVTRMVISNSSLILCDSLINSVTRTLLDSRTTLLPGSVSVKNYTYEKISDNSYAINITFKMNSITVYANNDCNKVNIKNTINQALNKLLNKLDAEHFTERKSEIQDCSNKPMKGYMEYSFQDDAIIRPASFIDELLKQNQSSLTACSKSSPVVPCAPSHTTINGSAVVQVILVFNNFTPENHTTLYQYILSTMLTNLYKPSITYLQTSNSSYVVNITFNITNVNMSNNPGDRNATYTQLESYFNNTINTLLNLCGPGAFNLTTSNFTISEDKVKGCMEYNLQGSLNPAGNGTSPTGPITSPPASSPTINGSAGVQVILVFNNSTPENHTTLYQYILSTMLTNLDKPSITYLQTSNSSYVVNITFNITNVNMSNNPGDRNATYTQLESFINNTINTLLNLCRPGAFNLTTSNFTSAEDKVKGCMEYNLQGSLNPAGNGTSPTGPITSPPASSPTINGSAVVQVILVFNNSTPENHTTLYQYILSTMLTNLYKPCITYLQTSNSSYVVNITFNITNVNMSNNPGDRNATYTQLESFINNTINMLLNLCGPGAFNLTTSNFTSSEDKVKGCMEYNLQGSLNPAGNGTSPTGPITSPPASSPTINGSAVVQVNLVYNSSTPLCNQTEVICAIEALLNSTLANNTEDVTVLNITFQETSNGSYTVNITFKISNVTMPNDTNNKNDTYNQLANIIHGIINDLLNNSNATVRQPTTSNFTCSGDKVDGTIVYELQNANNWPLNGTSPTCPITSPPASSPTINGSAVVQVSLVYNSSTPLCNQTEVICAIEALLNSTLANNTEDVTVLNITFQETSNGSYTVNITFKISNVTMPNDTNNRNDTYNQLANIIHGIINDLLNNSNATVRQLTTSNFTCSGDKVDGTIVYELQNANNWPLNGTSPTCPITSPPASSPTINGSAVVQVSLVYNSSTPLCNQTEVICAIEALLNSTLANDTEDVTVLNITFQETSNGSYTVNITFKISNVTMPNDTNNRNDTYNQLANIIHGIINDLLNNSNATVRQLTTSNFTCSGDKVDGTIVYELQNANNWPLNGTSPTCPITSPPASSPTINGSAVVQVSLVYNSSTPLCNQTEVICAIEALLNSTLANNTEDVTVLNITFQETSNGSYTVNITFKISNVTMPNDTNNRNDTYNQLANIIHGIINDLLNNSNATVRQPTTSNFTCSVNKVYGTIVYELQNANNWPLNGTSPTCPITSPPASSPTINGSAVVQVSLVYNSSTPLCNQTEVICAIEALLNSTLANDTEDVTVLNITFQETSNGSYTVNITFKISNVTMPNDTNNRNDTYNQLANIIHGIINDLLNNSNATVRQPITSNFTSSVNKVYGTIVYELQNTNNWPLNGTSPTCPITSPPASSPTINGSAVVQVSLVYNSSTPLCNQTEVIGAIEALLNSTLANDTEDVTVLNITFQETSNGSYTVNITFKISNVTMPNDTNNRNDTYSQLANIIHGIINDLLNNSNATVRQPTTSNFTCSGDKVDGTIVYELQNANNWPLNGATQTGPITSPPASSPTIPLSNGSAVVHVSLVYNSSTPLTNQTEVIGALEALLNSTLANNTEDVTVLNITFQETSNGSYTVNITFKISNVTMPNDTNNRNDTYNQLANIIHGIINDLLNNSNATVRQPTTSNFTCSGDKVDGTIVYELQNANNWPLNGASPTGPITSPPASSPTIPLSNGSAVVHVSLVYNSSTPLTNQSEVIGALEALLNSTLANNTEDVTVLNITFQETSNGSYTVNITFKNSNVTMPNDTNNRNDTYNQLANIIHGIINDLLNNSNATVRQPTTSNFTCSGDKVDGTIVYELQNANNWPLNGASPTGPITSPPASSPTIPLSNGSAVVHVSLVYNSSTPLTNQSEVIGALEALLNSTLANNTEDVTVLNITFQETSNGSYTVNITFKISNVTMPNDTNNRNDTYNQLANIIHGIINDLLNNSNATVRQPTTSNFTCSGDKVDGTIVYELQNANNWPLNGASPTGPITSPPASSPTIPLSNGSAVVHVSLVYNSSTPLTNQTEVIGALEALLNSTLANNTEDVTVLNITFQETSNGSYTVNITFKINNVTMPNDTNNRNDTYNQLANIIHGIINDLLNNSNATVGQPTTSNFTCSGDKVDGTIVYELQNANNWPLNGASPTGPITSPPASSPTIPLSNGSAVVQVSLVYNSSTPLTNQTEVIGALEALLNSTLANNTEDVTVLNITFQETSNGSYTVNITFKISNVTMPNDTNNRNDTYNQLANIIHGIINDLLNNSNATVREPTTSNFTCSGDKVDGTIVYELQNANNWPLNGASPTGPITSPPASSPTIPLSNGSAVVQVSLVYNSSTPLTNQTEVIGALEALLNSTLANNTEDVTVLNITFQETSNGSYTVNITFKISNVTMPNDTNNRNDTYNQLANIIHGIINDLLNNSNATVREPTTSNFTCSGDKVDGTIVYELQNANNWPLNGASPTGPITSPPASSPTIPLSNGSAVVHVSLVYNSSTPLTNQSEVIGALEALLNSTLANNTEDVTVLNITFQETSNGSYTVNITFKISNVTMPNDTNNRNDTYNQLANIIHGIINDLLNNSNATVREPTTSNFTCSGDKVDGTIVYELQNANNWPLNGASPTGPITSPPASSPTINGSAVVQVILVFNNSTPENHTTLYQYILSTMLTNLDKPSITYLQTSNSSYVVNITLDITNVNMSNNPGDRNATYTQLESFINNTINTLLNSLGHGAFNLTTSNFTSSEDKVKGCMEYNLQGSLNPAGNDTSSKVSPTIPPGQTPPGPSPTIPLSNGSAVVHVSLVYNSSTPLTNQTEVIGALEALLNSTLANNTEDVTVLNITFQETSNGSYTVNITFKISNVTMPNDTNNRNDTYNQLANIIHGIINDLLNNSNATVREPTTSNFTCSGDKVDGTIVYELQNANNWPLNGASPTGPITSPPASSPTIPLSNGSAVVHVSLVYNSSTPLTNQTEVIGALEALLNSTLANNTEDVTVLNITFQETSNGSYTVNITFKISNVTMLNDTNNRNDTYNQLANIIHGIINKLHNFGTGVFDPTTSDFMSSGDKINGYMEYNLQSFPTQLGNETSQMAPPNLSTDINSTESDNIKNRTVIIYIKLIFQKLINLPSKDLVIKIANEKLETMFTRARNSTTQKLEQPVRLQDINYTKINDSSFSLDMMFKISNVLTSDECESEMNKETYDLIQNEINSLMNAILTSPQSQQLTFPQANFTCNNNEALIVAHEVYVYEEGQIKSPSPFLHTILKESGQYYYTQSPFELIQSNNASGNDTNTGAAWILGFIIPCAIVLMLLPCWILLCCLLCGCCARFRKRWSQRPSHNVQYQPHQTLF